MPATPKVAAVSGGAATNAGVAGAILKNAWEIKMTARVIGIFGPPGTGKTTRIGAEINARVPSQYHPSETICTSFTRAAAVAMAGPETELDPELSIRTLHSFGFRTFEAPVVIGAENRRRGQRTITDEWNDEYPGWEIGQGGDAPLSDCARMRNLMLPLDAFTEADWFTYAQHVESRRFWPEWRQFKNMHGALDFTDLLERPLAERLPPPNGARFAVIDEAQDFTPLQVMLIRQWAEDMDEIILALDDDQSIYSHLGADPSYVINWPGMEKIHLDRSYRLPGAVHAYSQDWIEQLGDRREPKPFAPRADGYMGRVEHRHEMTARRPEDELVGICEAVARSKQSIMVLTANNYQLRPVTKALQEAGVPFHNPYRTGDPYWNPLTANVRRVGRLTATDQAWDVGRLADLLAIVRVRGVFTNGAESMRFCNDKAESTPVDLADHLIDPDVRIDGQWLRDHAKKSAQGAVAYGDRIQRAGFDIDEPLVIPSTIHAVKGGEADVVALFPDLSRAQGGMGEYSDATIRQFYVGMTRARKDVLIGHPTEIAAVRLP